MTGGATKLRSRLALLAMVPAMLALTGCEVYYGGFFCKIPRDPAACEFGDKCYIEDAMFVKADRLYSNLGSISLVEKHLCEIEQWRRCEINEALYRLKKVHNLP